MQEVTFEREVLERLIKIEDKLDGFSKAKQITYNNESKIALLENDMGDIENRLAQLEDSNKWLSRSLIAAIITGVVGFGFALIKVSVGI